MPHPAIHSNTEPTSPKNSPRKASAPAESESFGKQGAAVEKALAQGAADAPANAPRPALPRRVVDTQANFFDRPPPAVATQNPAAPVPAAIDSKLLAEISAHMRTMNQNYNYDRMVNTNAYGAALKRQGLANGPQSPKQLVEAYPVDSGQWLREEGGGNCVGLCGHLMDVLNKKGLEPTLIGSTLKRMYTIKGGPRIGHVAVLLSADVGARKKQLLLEPGFNFPHPIVLPDLDEGPIDVPYDGGKWVMTRKHPIDQARPVSPNEVYAYVIPGADPDKPQKDADFPKKNEDVATYFLEPLAHNGESITRAIVAVDKRPIMLARNPAGKMLGLVALNYANRTLSLRFNGKVDSFHIDKFKEVGPGELPPTSIDVGALAEALNYTPKALAEKLHTAAALADTLHPLPDPNAAPPPKTSGKKKKT